MEVITFESKAYQELTRKIDLIVDKLQSVPEAREKEAVAWLDSKAVCQMLNISTRTLYRLKKERLIGFSVLRGRCLFKRCDVEQTLQNRAIVTQPETLDELLQNHSVQSIYQK